MTKQSNALKTGNSKATKPGKGDRFALTQAEHDVAFDAGRAVAGAIHSAAGTLLPLLTPLSGQSSPEAIDRWAHLRAAFVAGFAAERMIDPDSASRAWTRVVDLLGLDKPQSEAARAKQAKREAERAANAPQEAGEGEGSPKDGAGAEAAAKVSMVLSSMEAHLIALVRGGKFEMAAECVAGMADAV